MNTRRTIVRAAAQLWRERGYNETTVEDICRAAGVGRSTYYLHFESKERLLTELALATARGVAADVERAVEGGSLEAELAAFVDGLVRRMEGTPRSLTTAIMRQVSVGNVSPSRHLDGDEILFDDILTRILREGRGRGEVRSDVEPQEIGEVLAGMILDALQRWAGGDAHRTLRQSLELRIDLVLNAVRTPDRAHS